MRLILASGVFLAAFGKANSQQLPNHGWNYETACAPPNILATDVVDCMEALADVQWNCAASEGPGNAVSEARTAYARKALQRS